MNQLLLSDADFFAANFKGAHRFLNAAHLRYEYFSLKTREHSCGINAWESARIKEIEKTPAVQELFTSARFRGLLHPNHRG